MTERFKRKPGKETTVITVEISWECKELLKSLSKTMGVRQSELCRVWMEQINPADESLRNKIRHIRAAREVEKLSKTRISLINQLRSKDVLGELNNMSDSDLRILINRIRKRRNK